MENNEQLSLSWVAHQRSICSGLSQLQQHGEFVDMTLAADGHHVKVHQMVLSLVSPYIKDLILTAQCPHPIIFLNNISYTTLCGILEYIYTGEVLVPKHRLSDLIAAGKALHIKGLREVTEKQTEDSNTEANSSVPEKKGTPKEKTKTTHHKVDKARAPVPTCKIYLDESNRMDEDSPIYIQDSMMETQDECTVVDETSQDAIETSQSATDTLNTSKKRQSDKSFELTSEETRKTLLCQKLQYSVSIQGGLQVIHNRYIYNLRYNGKKNRRRWRCVDYSSPLKCPAAICTDENNKVSERSFTHNHGFHDSKIIKKLRNGIIYLVLNEAALIADGKKKERRVPCSVTDETSE